jgi:multiple antibiotic resistance protein
LVELTNITILALLPISNPFSTVPLFLSLTRGQSDAWAQQQALRIETQ